MVQNAIVPSRYGQQRVALIERAQGSDVNAVGGLKKEAIEPDNESLPEQARSPERHVIRVNFGGFIDLVYGKGGKKVPVSGRPRSESVIETTEVMQVLDDGNVRQ
ncbi:hypothetical protein SCAR479_07396 [Seiridium cardinale]|uniref:Uncharacterized protein n=1 Tax=Seiridium cardinale TaxID=138064 RepID=A0ABR2XQJ5_9PEZI